MGGQEAAVGDRVLTLPNALSLVRLLLVPVFAWLIVQEYDVWALAVIAFSGASDWWDGYLARRWHQESRLGELLDPAADRLYILATLLGLAYREIVPWWFVALVVARDVVLVTTAPALARRGYGPLPVAYLGKAATFNLLYAFPLLLLAQVDPALAVVVEPLGWAFAWWGAGLYWWAGVRYLQQVRRIARTEPRRRRGTPPPPPAAVVAAQRGEPVERAGRVREP